MTPVVLRRVALLRFALPSLVLPVVAALTSLACAESATTASTAGGEPLASAVIETGYLSCGSSATGCGEDLECVGGDGATVCIEIPTTCANVASCACLADAVCGPLSCKDVSIDGAAGLVCADPDADSDGDGSNNADDCAPIDASVGPNAAELCNAIDDDCDGEVDEDCTDPSGAGGEPGVCVPSIEMCNAVDDDCDGLVDEDCGDADSDGDGSNNADDCAPADASVGPNALELCNAIDDDCDGEVDEGCN